MTATAEQQQAQQQDDDNNDATDTTVVVDDEGLLRHYNVILVGTGLVQSLLAAALARAGRTVLHVDAFDFYGELDAVWTLPYLQECVKLCGNNATTTDSSSSTWLFGRGPDVKNDDNDDNKSNDSGDNNNNKSITISRYGSLHDLQMHAVGRTFAQGATTVLPPLNAGTCVTHAVWGPAKVLGWKRRPGGDNDDNDTLQSQQPTVRDDYYLVLELVNWKLSHDDGNTTTTCARMSTTDWDALVPRSVELADEILTQRSRSFAIDVTPGLIWAQGPAVLGLLQSSVSDYCEFKSLEQLWWYDHKSRSKKSALQKVPCSKNDVFASALLSPMEKRRLMTFLQLALDYSIAASAEQETAAQAEEQAAAAGVALPAAWETLNERHLNQGRSLARPQNKSVPAAGLETLQQCIQEEMDWHEYLVKVPKLSPKLAALVRYALALDFGCNQMTVRQGMQQLGQHLQSLGRFGSTAFLVPMFGSGELAQAFCRSAAVYGATYLLRRSVASVALSCSSDKSSVEGVYLRPYDDDHVNDNKQESSHPNEAKCKRVGCSHVIVPEHAVLTNRPVAKRRVLRRVSILIGKPTTPECVRHAILLPPGSLPVSQHAYTIHGLWFDESINVTPSVHECGGCSMLHLTTVVDVADDNGLQQASDAVLQEAVDAILADSSSPVTEIYHVSFSFPLYETTTGEPHDWTIAQGLHVIQRPQPSLTVDEAFQIAQKTFSKICPDVEFLTLSKEIDNLVKERFGDRLEEDDEQLALSNAMNLIQSNEQSSSSSMPLFIWLGDVENKGESTHRLLLPVPRPVEPTPSCLDSHSVINMIQEHCSVAGHDPRVYFATCSGTNQETLDFADLIKSVISGCTGPNTPQFQAFTNGTVDALPLSAIGLDGIHVSLFAADATGYGEATRLGEGSFQAACAFVEKQAKAGVSVEVGLLGEHAEAGRVFARTLGAKEVHIFDK